MRKKSGVSLIIAIIFVSVLMLVTAGLAEVNLAAIKNRANKTWSDRAKDLSAGALELAYYFADGKVGANATSEDAKNDGTFKKTWDEYTAFLQPLGVECADCAGFRIIGRSEASKNEGLLQIGDSGSLYYSVPAAYMDGGEIKGTGSAAEKCENPTDADDPCHWNRIYVNDIVDVPLYYMDSSGVKSLSKTDKFKLRVRAPCENYKDNCATNERVELYPKAVSKNEYATAPFGDPKKDKVLIQWLIRGLDNSGETLFARDVLDKDTKKRPLPSDNTTPDSKNFVGLNTEISGGRINDANEALSPASLPLSNFIMLEQYYWGMYANKGLGKIWEFIKNLSKPTLRLNLIGQPRKLNNESVPYLEYQILTDKPIADSKVTLFGWAEIADSYKEFKAEKYLPIMEGGLVLGNL